MNHKEAAKIITEKKEVLGALQEIDNYIFNPPMSSLKTLNRYFKQITGVETDLKCSDCRGKMVGFFRKVKDEWTKKQ